MTIDDIYNLAASGESEALELKQSTAQLGTACESLCGFLNSRQARHGAGRRDAGERVAP